MSKSLNSPTARILRSSRLFSLPPPLPAAPLEGITSSGTLRSSDTATLPYPTHQAISTPSSSRFRGDWGLKRPLPKRSIPASSPHLRIQAIDNINHITDFQSAADHTQTVAKWQELNMPMTMPGPGRNTMTDSRRTTPISAFEEDLDNTAFNAFPDASLSAERAMVNRDGLSDGSNKQQQKQRWKTEGPWVSGLTEDEFHLYLVKTVRQNKAEFMQFLRQVRQQQKKKDITQAMRDEGLLNDENPQALELQIEQQSQVGEKELLDWIKELRDSNTGYLSELSTLIRDFFDLPPFPKPADSGSAADAFQTKIFDALMVDGGRIDGPPATHPSAGLSYLRTSAFMENHPIYGPQAEHEPVQARVLAPRNPALGRSTANLGVAGFVTKEPSGSTPTTNFNSAANRSKYQSSADRAYTEAVGLIDPELAGGKKLWVKPSRAYVDETGRIQLTLDRASEQAVGVKIGEPIEAPEPARLIRPSGRFDERLDARPRISFGRAGGTFNRQPASGNAPGLNGVDEIAALAQRSADQKQKGESP